MDRREFIRFAFSLNRTFDLQSKKLKILLVFYSFYCTFDLRSKVL